MRSVVTGTGSKSRFRRKTQRSSPAADQRVFAIIGGGAAGALAAQTLRQPGFGGRIVMLDPENRVPYDRTLLSKYHLSGQPGAEKSPLQSQAFYNQHAIERRTGRREPWMRSQDDPLRRRYDDGL